LTDLMIDTLALLEPEYRGRVEVRREFAEAPDIYCYASELGQVFMNLLRNSVQAIDGAGDITIRMGAHDQAIVIEIADTGRGIPPDQLARLFEAGFNNREKRVKASLSLFAAASIVRRHGGTLDAVSRVGEGSTFTLTLPRSLERAESGLVGASAKAG
jgi:signal transduction histidine kinase